jgi:hypothetical protein
MRLIAIVTVVGILAFALPCWAGGGKGYVSDFDAASDNSHVKFALHFAAHGTAGCGGKATPLPVFTTRENLVRQWNTLGDVDVFFVVFAYDSIFNFEYGLTWPADWGSCSTTVCAGDLVIGDILQRGSGLASGFNNCQVSTNAGGTQPNIWPTAFHWFTVSSAGEIQIIKNPAPDDYGVVACTPPESPTHSTPESLFFGGVQMDPWEGPAPNALQPTTWGAVKALFK